MNPGWLSPIPPKLKLPVRYDKLSAVQRQAVRRAYSIEQDGKCKLCKQPLDQPPADFVLAKPVDPRIFPPGFFKHPVHLHHDHKSGMTVGAMHARCNAAIFQYRGI